MNVCLGCHAEQAEQHKKKHSCTSRRLPRLHYLSRTAREDNQHLLRVASPNKLCLECHGPDRKPQKLESEHLVAIFDGKVKLPENYFDKALDAVAEVQPRSSDGWAPGL